MKIRKINLNRKQVLLLLINGILLMAFIVLSVFAKNTVKGMYSQQEADRWEDGEISYAQVSAFVSPERGMQKEGLSLVRSSIMETLSKDSYNETKGNGRVWIDAYSGECKADIRKDMNTLNVTAVGVGGDFFQFHPIPLLSGSYISDEDLNNDRIIVDENFAWAMFGSNDIVGMQVWMGNSVFVIAGVVAVEEDTLYQTAYGSSNRVYMSYDQLKKQQENLNITCYEAVLPNPISNYAYYALRSAFGMEEESEEQIKQDKNPLNFDQVEIIENSNRYEVMPLLTKAKNLKLRSMRTNSIGYPYWENIARVAEEKQMILLIGRILLLIFPCICLILWLYGLWSHKTWTAKSIFLGVIERIRERQEAKREAEALESEEPEEQSVKEADEEEEGFEEDEESGESDEEIILEDEAESCEEMIDEAAGEPEHQGEETALYSLTGDDVFKL